MTGAERQEDHIGATDALAWADRLEETAWRRSRWFTRVLLAFALVTLVGTAVPVFVRGIWAGAVFAAIYGGFGVVIALAAGRAPKATPWILRRHVVIITVWTVLYVVVVSGGVVWFPYEPAWWLPGAAIVALPLFVGAYLEHRHQSTREKQ